MTKPELPSKTSFNRLDTLALPPAERFESWRSLHDTAVLEAPNAEVAGDYRASLLWCRSDEGVIFGHAVNPETVTTFNAHGPDQVLLTQTTGGAARIGLTYGETHEVTNDSSLHLIDCKSSLRIATSRMHSHVYLALPRRLVLEWFGGDPFSRAPVRALPDDGLFEFLRAHMGVLSKSGQKLTGAETAMAMQVLVSLAMGGLQNLGAGDPEQDDPRSTKALFLSATYFIEMRHGDPNLTATVIAAFLGCSRAHLYRVFSAHGWTVGGFLRETRLNKAKTLLEGSRRRNIGQVAADAGYGDVSSFSRAFRDRFGMPPGAWRAGAAKR
ncbi:helix-turn-helix transcriptional regulator [Tepidicaulis sp. LMO-SS28]|uniref:AraC family transcriptional regulator n=1 Tax=Tepidicaulis sp. LMO-SS28 TaxID=3447455 RepID=UPI003EDFCB7C